MYRKLIRRFDIVKIYSALKRFSDKVLRLISRAYNTLHTSKRANIVTWILIIAISFGMLFVNCLVSPMYSDDLRYLCKIEYGQTLNDASIPLASICDVFESQYNHYFFVNGRTVAHLALQLGLYLLGRPLLIVIIPLIIIGLIFVILLTAAACRGEKKLSKTGYCLAFSLIYLLNPTPEDTFFWITGFFNYTLTITIVLLFFLCVCKLVGNGESGSAAAARSSGGGVTRAALMLLFGIIAGWTNENIGPSLALVLLFIILYRKLYLRVSSPAYLFTGLVGTIVGSGLLILAPGNFSRVSALSDKLETSNGLMGVVSRLYYMERAVFDYLFPAIAVLAAAVIVNRLFVKISAGMIADICIGWAVVSIAAMILSPSYPPRAAMGSLVLMIIPSLAHISCIQQHSRRASRYISLFAAFIFIVANAQLFSSAFYTLLK